MCRLFPCIPIFRAEEGGWGVGGGLLKSVKKKMCLRDIIKIALLPMKNEFIHVRKGTKRIMALVSCKTHYGADK